jgi:hypothetical protein
VCDSRAIPVAISMATGQLVSTCFDTLYPGYVKQYPELELSSKEQSQFCACVGTNVIMDIPQQLIVNYLPDGSAMATPEIYIATNKAVKTCMGIAIKLGHQHK